MSRHYVKGQFDIPVLSALVGLQGEEIMDVFPAFPGAGSISGAGAMAGVAPTNGWNGCRNHRIGGVQ